MQLLCIGAVRLPSLSISSRKRKPSMLAGRFCELAIVKFGPEVFDNR